MGFGKGADILFSKPEVFLKTEVNIVTATEQEKGKLFSLYLFICIRKSSIPEIGTTAIRRE